MSIYMEIFFTFLKLGACSFGGGYAAIPIMENEICHNKKWIEHEKLYDILSISQALPGAVALNASTFVGYSIAGIPGALVALLGNLLPSVVIVWILTASFVLFRENQMLQNAFNGIRPTIIALITFAAYNIAKSGIKDWITSIIFIGAFVACLVFDLPPIPVIITSAIAGVIITGINKHMRRKLL